MTGDSGGGDSGRENIVGNPAAVLRFDAKSKSSKIEFTCDETLGIPPIQSAKFRLSTKGNCTERKRREFFRADLLACDGGRQSPAEKTSRRPI